MCDTYRVLRSWLVYKNEIIYTFWILALLVHYLMEISLKHGILPIHSFKLLCDIL